MSNFFNLIKVWFFGKKDKLNYPADFAIIDFTDIAVRLGQKDNRNKIIYRYSINRFGNYELKKYPYSEERVKVLQEVHLIPIFDKTKKDIRFPVYSKVLPGEVVFKQNR